MSNSDTWFPKWDDIPAAIGLLSRLPVRVETQQAQARGAHPSWAYGLAGALLGALAALRQALRSSMSYCSFVRALRCK